MKNTLAKVEWQEDRRFIGSTATGFSLSMDGGSLNGEDRQAPGPMELILQGLAACSMVDVVSIIQKKKLDLASCEVDIDAQRAESIPAVFTSINLHFKLKGEKLNDKAVAQAISLSVDKYCSVAKMLRDGGVKISSAYTIIN